MKNEKYIAHIRASGEQQSLAAHLSGVSRLCSARATKLGLGKNGELIGLLHDLGKYSDEFQRYLRSAVGLLNQDEDEDFVDAEQLKGRVDHSTAGAQLLWSKLSQSGPLGELVGQALALCVASHHSGLIDCLGADSKNFGMDIFCRRMMKADERTHLMEVWDKADADIRERVEALLEDDRLISELHTVLLDIVRREPEPIAQQQKLGLMIRYLFSCLIDADRLDTASFEKPRANAHRPLGDYRDWTSLVGRLEAHLALFNPEKNIDHLRREISEHCLKGASRDKGIFKLSVPTGGGKTLASLRFALHHAAKHELDRIIYVIPYTSIIDQNAAVAREVLESGEEKSHIVLEHHANLTAETQGWREKLLTENWDAPVIFTTMVQFLETLFGAGTRGARRMHQLANSVLIFDEIQSLPIRCVHLFNNAINFLVEHCGSTVVLCTATQPLLDKVPKEKGAIRLGSASELIPDVGALFDALKRVDVIDAIKPGGWVREEIIELACRETQASDSCLVIVNTKEAARALFRLCQEAGDVPAFHLSTSMCAAHRKMILAEVRTRLDAGERLVCISTQLIEAGVDVDFGAVIRFAAGLDSIAQAAGRCNRNGKRARGRVHVINPRPEDENLDSLHDIRIGRDKTARVLNDFAENGEKYRHNLIGPEAMDWYYRNYFHDRINEMEYPLASRDLGHEDSLLQLLSANQIASREFSSRNPGKNRHLRHSFMTAAKNFRAIDAPTRGVVVPYGEQGREVINDLCAAFEVEKQYDLLRAAQQYAVNVFPHELDRLQRAGAVHAVPGTEILCLDTRYYSTDFGLVTEPAAPMGALVS